MAGVPAGKYKAEWVGPLTGKVIKAQAITATGMPVELASPELDPDVAIRIRRN